MASSAPRIDCDGGPVQLPGISQSGKEHSEGVMLGCNFITGFSACLILLGIAAARADRASEIVTYDEVRIEVIAEGSGPLVVLLPLHRWQQRPSRAHSRFA